MKDKRFQPVNNGLAETFFEHIAQCYIEGCPTTEVPAIPIHVCPPLTEAELRCQKAIEREANVFKRPTLEVMDISFFTDQFKEE